jgi:hypothetical protein
MRARRVAGVVAALALVCGCSASNYDAEYAKRIGEYRVAGEFARLRPTPTIVGGGIAELRLPTLLVNQLDGTEESKRSTPPFLRDFPGFAAAYEATCSVRDEQFPVVLTVGVVPTTERRKDEVEDTILQQVRAGGDFDKPAWQKGRELVDAAGVARKWDVLELVGQQPFDVIKAGVTTSNRQDGTTEVWVSADPAQKACVVLAWRVAQAAAGSLPLPELSTLTARTVRVANPQP